LPAAKFPRFLRARKVSACQEEASTPPVAATALVAGLFTPLFIIFRADHHSSDTRETLPGDSPWGIGVRFYREVALPRSGNGSSVTQEGGFRPGEDGADGQTDARIAASGSWASYEGDNANWRGPLNGNTVSPRLKAGGERTTSSHGFLEMNLLGWPGKFRRRIGASKYRAPREKGRKRGEVRLRTASSVN